MDVKFYKNSFIHHKLQSPPRLSNLKISPDKLQGIIKIVNTRYEKFSPSGCSKNVLAANSNLDAEIESIKRKLISPDPYNFKKPPHLTLTPSPKKFRLPDIKSSRFSMLHDRDISLPTLKKTIESDSSRLSLHPYHEIELQRAKKIDDIISSCKEVEHNTSFNTIRSDRTIKKSRKYFNSIVKFLEGTSIEQKLVERCKEDAQEFEEDQNDLVKMSKVLKRSKKIWKQNHIAFMKNIDRMVYSIPLKKPN